MTSDESIVRLDYVIFLNVKEHYFCNSSLQVKIKFDPSFPFSDNDWVGLFKVGWMSVKESLFKTYIPKQALTKLEYNLSIDSVALPEDEDEFFHLCYITQNEQLAGVSIPFQFSSDFEIIDKYQQYDSIELCSKIKEVEFDNSRLKNEMESLQRENELLSMRVNELTCSGGTKENHQTARKNSFSFMDEYYNESSQAQRQVVDSSPVTRPIGFENVFPNRWVTYENHPNTAYPEPTWLPNPYINYRPGPNGSFNH